jgi:hypothetical protein
LLRPSGAQCVTNPGPGIAWYFAYLAPEMGLTSDLGSVADGLKPNSQDLGRQMHSIETGSGFDIAPISHSSSGQQADNIEFKWTMILT